MEVSGLMAEEVVDKKVVEAEVMVEVEVILSEISLVTVILEVEVYQVGLDQMDYRSNY